VISLNHRAHIRVNKIGTGNFNYHYQIRWKECGWF